MKSFWLPASVLAIGITFSYFYGFYLGSHQSNSASVTESSIAGDDQHDVAMSSNPDSQTRAITAPSTAVISKRDVGDYPYIERSLAEYGMSLHNLDAQKWQQFLNWQGIGYIVDQLGDGNTLFDAAIKANNTQLVKQMLAFGFDVNEAKPDGEFNSPLQKAAYYGDIEMFRTIFDVVNDVNDKRYRRLIAFIVTSSLSEASKHAKIQYSLDHGYRLTDVGFHVMPLLRYGNLDSNPYLSSFEGTIDFNQKLDGSSAMLTAIRMRANDATLQDLIADFHPEQLAKQEQSDILHRAVISRDMTNITTFEDLLDSGLNPNLTDRGGYTAVMKLAMVLAYSSKSNISAELVDSTKQKLAALLARGADVTIKNHKDQTVFDLIDQVKVSAEQKQQVRDLLN
ncbi:Ankyrin repeat-containing protein [Vibrio xiamenensis]|uniref:Ankyrin repeat-containing protein n=1 Tax=Vibrio xiamenensis TaxID=861298 RepID=A0A1G7XUC9_9VIBR|nr:ankyrin repeat domain-containing protein [Vibrio xiamenensis]SDG76441.1 Ankyrin repeat-containing protein [Vibrio xiamenensis]SDG87716.1 Ankyrin repeat-containing protein [Vibrio xiamenensis]